MEKKILTVTELNYLIKTAVENSPWLANISVVGEISNLTFNRSGHIYFSIKDQTATIRCLIWKDNAQTLKRWNPQDGMKITCTGRLTYYLAGGSLSLEVREVSLEGKGELQELYEKRFALLEKQGWFAESIKKPIPKFPKNIGIVTADTGAVIHDLISTITRRFPLVDVYLFPCQVQGEQARNDVVKKIQQANNFAPQLDVLIVGRGGGSYEDLWTFNEMEVLQAVRNSQIPIISAVGHEPDVTLMDYVADKRAATPTAAAELATPNVAELKQNLVQIYQELKKEMENYFAFRTEWIKNANRTTSHYLQGLLAAKEANLQSLYQNSIDKINLFWQLKVNDLANLELQWKLVSPLMPLEKGYALIYDQKQVLIRDIKKLKIGQKIDLRTKQGTVETQVRRILLEGGKK